jgi:probable rRNA maturation factor
MINVLISEPFLNMVATELLEQAALATLEQQQVADMDQDLSIAVEDDERLHSLNKEFLDIDAPTDVLSFPAGDDEIDPESGALYLGDIIISYPRALEQANTAGHPVMDEIQLLVVHGVLHLLGHDHAEPDEHAIMWAAQREVLLSLGIDMP